MEPALVPPRKAKKPSENRDKLMAVARESMAHLLFGPMTQASVALGAAIDPDHVRRVYAESLERLLDGLERR